MRVGLFGGTFDPPHRGHVALARLARERLSLDRVLVAPVATQPLKRHSPAMTDFADRVAMTRLAFAGEKKTEISLIDKTRAHDAKSPNYTIDTVAALRKQLMPEDTLFFILGADSLLDVRRWHRAPELLLACDFIVGARPGFRLDEAVAALPEGISTSSEKASLPHTQVIHLSGPRGGASRIYLLLDLDEDVSATQIRASLRNELGAPKILNPAVAGYIRAHHLYEHL